jgi:predicted enzyme related to lactoylglutathione lyase
MIYAKSTLSRCVGVLLTATLLAACGTQRPNLPALSTSGAYQPGKIVWHDLVTPDLAASQDFYGKLFGWTFDEVTTGYVIVRNETRMIGGMASLDSGNRAGYWVPQMSVPDVDKAVNKTTSAGGQALLKPFDLPDRGRVALVRDPEGGVFGLIRTARGDPPDSPAALNEWLWHEIWSQNVEASERFYTSLAGFTVSRDKSQGTNYRLMTAGGRPRLAVADKPGDLPGNTWAVYVRVADVDAMTAKAESLGATVLMAPRSAVRHGSVAIITDPTGAGLVLQEWKQ